MTSSDAADAPTSKPEPSTDAPPARDASPVSLPIDSPLAAVQRWFDRALPAWVIAVVLLYALALTGTYRPMPDAGSYLTIARNVLDGKGMVQPVTPNHGASPAFVGMIALTFRLFGDGNFLALHLVMLGWAGLYLLVAWWWLRWVAPRRAVPLLWVLLATTETVYFYAYHCMPDLPFGVGFLLMLTGWEMLRHRLRPSSPPHWMDPPPSLDSHDARARKSAMLRGGAVLLTGLALMAAMRSVVVTVLAALVLTLMLDRLAAWRQPLWRKLAVTVTAGAAMLGAVIFLAWLLPPSVLWQDLVGLYQRVVLRAGDTLQLAFTERLPHILSEGAGRAMTGIDLGLGNYITGVWLLVTVVLLWRRRPLWVMLLALFVLQWLVAFADRRYFLPLMPILLMGWWQAAVAFERWRCRDLARGRKAWWLSVSRYAAVGCVLLIWLAPNLARDVRFIARQRQYGQGEHHDNGENEKLEAIGALIAKETPSDAVVMSRWKMSSSVMFFSRRPVTQYWQSIDGQHPGFAVLPLAQEQLRAIEASGHRIGATLGEIKRLGDRPPWQLVELVPVNGESAKEEEP